MRFHAGILGALFAFRRGGMFRMIKFVGRSTKPAQSAASTRDRKPPFSTPLRLPTFPWPALVLMLVVFPLVPISVAIACDLTVNEGCIDEVITNVGDARTLHVTVSSGSGIVEFFQVIGPNQKQAKLNKGGRLHIGLDESGGTVYSVQACWDDAVEGTFCHPWKQFRRNFAPLSVCKTYVANATKAIADAAALGCGFKGERWNPDPNAHYTACIDNVGDWQALVNNETNGRATQLNKCRIEKKPIRPVGGNGPVAGVAEAMQVAKACSAYAKRMDARVNEARALKCAFFGGSNGWDHPHAYWADQCARWKAGASVKVEEDSFQRNLDQCKSGDTGGAGGGKTYTAVAEVTMYDGYQHGNRTVCYIYPGDKLGKLAANGATGKWLHLRGNSGDCNGKTGFVYNEGELK
ncbi:MAG: hypothetical protein J0H94_11250 [Rhizobiales bacterium]|nr:hypothetical protein [Hyphomicrobiales bacterium]